MKNAKKLSNTTNGLFLDCFAFLLKKKFWSERRELNPRPQAPQTCAIPLRYAPTSLRTLPEVSGNLLTDTTTLRPVSPNIA